MAHFPAETALFREYFQLFEQDGCLDGVQPSIDAYYGVLVLDLLAMVTDLSHLLRHSIIIREHRPAFTVAPQRLGWEKRSAADGRKATGFLPMMGSTETLGAILNNRNFVFRGNCVDPGHVRALTIDAHRHNGLGAWGDDRLDLVRVHIKSVGLDIHKYGFGVEERNDFGGGDPGIGHGNHFIARTDIQSHEGNEEGVGTA